MFHSYLNKTGLKAGHTIVFRLGLMSNDKTIRPKAEKEWNQNKAESEG